MEEIKPGDQVRMWIGPLDSYSQGYYVYGEVTIIKEDKVKVLFGDPLYDYGYYFISQLKLMKSEDI